MFAALPLPGPVLHRLEETARLLKGRQRELRTVRPEGMHITLRFFGELGEEEARRVQDALDDPALRIESIPAVLSGYGQFPPRGNPRVVWCGLGRGAAEVVAFQKTFEAILARAGFPPDAQERAFTPHITLARVPPGVQVPPGTLESLPPLAEAFPFDRLVLFQSILRREGAEYLPLKIVPFGKGGI